MKNKSDQFRPASRATRGRALLIRVLLFALVAVSVLVMSGSVNRLLKAQAQSRAANAQLARIESETEALQSKWRPEEIKELEERFAKLPSLLFPEQEALGEWLRNLRSRADPLALDAKVEFGTPTVPMAKSKNIATIPATVTVQLKPGEPTAPPRSPYHRLMSLMSHLIQHPRRADIVGIEVNSASNSINHAVANINLWAGEASM